MPRGEHLAPAPVGNQLATKHGCYSLITLAPRARELRADLEERVPLRSPADEATLDLAALVLAQVERAAAVLSNVQARESEAILDGRRVDKETAATLQRLSADLRGWVGRAERLLDQLGLTPRSRLALGLEVVRTQTAVETLNAYLEEKAARA